MLISVTSPKKGLGQTITTVNLGAVLARKYKARVLIIDINKYCRDVEYYLSDTHITKGLDDYISLCRANLLTEGSMKTCIKKVHGLDIMTANQCFELDRDVIRSLVHDCEKRYEIVLVDTIGGTNPITGKFMEMSDKIVVVLNPIRNAVDLVSADPRYKGLKDRAVFVVNRCMERYQDRNVTYGMEEVRQDLQEEGFRGPVLPLAFDIDVMNECNAHAVLNSVWGSNARNSSYLGQMNTLAEEILDRPSCSGNAKDKMVKKSLIRLGLFNF